jgi:hypothetical protein
VGGMMSYLLWLKLYLHVGFKKSAEFAEIRRNLMVTDFLKIGTVLIKTGIFYLKFNKKIRISFFQTDKFLNTAFTYSSNASGSWERWIGRNDPETDLVQICSGVICHRPVRRQMQQASN